MDIEAIRKTAAHCPTLWAGPGPHLLAIGRLAREKGFDLLLIALEGIQTHYPNAGLTILGAGPEESPLKNQCAALRLRHSVRFEGNAPQPSAYFPGAVAFVLPSRHEGLPNALLEAAAAGLPIVATPASGGIVELLKGQSGAWLTPEISAASLASTLLTALATLRFGERFLHSWIEEFSMDRAIRAYEELIGVVLRADLV